MKKAFFTFILSSFIAVIYAQSPKRILKKIGSDPIYFIDSVQVDKSELSRYDANQIASLTVLKGQEAMDIMGEDGKDGVIYIETKKFDKNKFWNYLKSKSPDYASLVPTIESDSTTQYILNKRVLKENFEGDLASVNDEIFKELKIIGKDALLKEYGINDKLFGVIIISDKPKNLYKARKKF